MQQPKKKKKAKPGSRYGIITATKDSGSSINPGSRLISYGLQYLITLVDSNSSFREICQDEYIREEWDLLHLDCLIIAGNPRISNSPGPGQFCDSGIFPYVERVQEGGRQIMDLFVGSSYYLPLKEIDVMADDLANMPKNQPYFALCNKMALVIARDRLMQAVLDRAMPDKTSSLLPCSAWWARDYLGVMAKQSKEYHVVVLRYLPRNEWILPRLEEIRNLLEQDGKPAYFLAHEEVEAAWASEAHPTVGAWIIVKNDPKELLEFYAGADRVVSLRTHGSLAALAMGARVTNLAVDSRAMMLEMFGVTSYPFQQLSQPVRLLDQRVDKRFDPQACEKKFANLFMRARSGNNSRPLPDSLSTSD